ncbi:MAG TPA: hypothetical protein VLI92_00470 [Candidatus Saccharimonadales bacterium]|nr:hypothetical protein [Candidatus Saccharimonadales bacterium]
MPLINIEPKDLSVQQDLQARMQELRVGLKLVACRISGFESTDILVNLLHPVVDADPHSADFVIYADTCPHEGLEARANELCEALALVAVELGFKSFEVWPRFLPGPWCLVQNGVIVDRVSHPRT